MFPIRKILLPTDFSNASKRALAPALTLAAEHDADLHLLHAITMGGSLGDLETSFPERDEILQRLFADAASGLGRLREAAGSEQASVRIVEERRHGITAGDVILEYAGEIGADLIVMGSHGRRGPRRWLIGSVAEEVVRHARCPVMTVREPRWQETADADLSRLESILVPIDFSTDSSEALEAARDMGAASGATIQALHVVDLQTLPAFYGVALGEIRQRLSAESDLKLAEITADTLGASAPFRCHTIEGPVGAAIVEFAAEHEIDLIVMPSHGRAGLEHWLLGSVAERVARTAPCPVLTLKPRDAHVSIGTEEGAVQREAHHA